MYEYAHIAKQRVKEAVTLRKMTQAELVEKTGIPKASISQYINGHHLPKQEAIYKLSEALSVRPDWLMGLNVPMEDKNKLDVTSTEKALVLQYRQLNNDDRNKLEGFLQALLLDGKYKKGGGRGCRVIPWTGCGYSNHGSGRQ